MGDGDRDNAGPRREARQTRSRRRVERILDAAAHVFAEVGIGAGTTNHIAERAEVSIGTVYQYFPDKRSILQALDTRSLARLETALGTALAESRTPADALDALLAALGLFLTAEQSAYREGTVAWRTRWTLVRETALERRLVTLVAARLGELAPGPGAERAGRMAHVLVRSAWATLAPPWPENVSREELLRELRELLGAYLAGTVPDGPR